MKKNKKILGMVLFILVVWLSSCIAASAEGEEPSSLYAQSAVLMDADSGRVLYAKNADSPMAMASTTKIMTCILTLELCSLDEVVDVSAYASTMPKVKLYVKQGEQYVLRDLLHSLMLESHNDVAVAIAEHVGKMLLGDGIEQKSVAGYSTEESKLAVAAFAKAMTDKAAEIGCTDTYFITPNGLDATSENGEHHSTATDMARIMAYCVQDSPKKADFLTITQTASHTFSANGRSFTCSNHNALLTRMSGVLSGKTGFTNKAGYCYVGALESQGRTYTLALLACGWPYNKNYKWEDSKTLFNYGMENFHQLSTESVDVAEKLPESIRVLNGQTEEIGGIAQVNVTIEEAEPVQLLAKDGENWQVEVDFEEVLWAPVKAGTEVGEITYLMDGVPYLQEKIVLSQSIDGIDFSWCLNRILELFLPGENSLLIFM
ncbi:MAG: D-alanyl-D-alanine carboxypeptidase [Lachnospiraceae bacterium]|nr:D-alanyl-D-alanine carboxypeptidase [Lachnospiraceae bacterium]